MKRLHLSARLLAFAGTLVFVAGCAEVQKPSVSGEYYLDRGLSYHSKGQYDQAIADHTKAIEWDPKYALAYTNWGYTYRGKRQYDQAIADYTTAIELNPKYAAAYNYRGNAYRGKRQYDQAISDFSKAMEIDPNHASAYNNLARLFATCADDKYLNGGKAIELAKKAVELESGISRKATYLDTLAAAYAEAGNYEEAISTQEKVIGIIKGEGMPAELARFTERLKSYMNHRPWREE